MRERLADGGDAAVATVVDVEGSAYRRPGAKMLVAPDGDALGAITAGCLEGPINEVARSVIERGERRLETYDLMDDDEWGLGMGCNGVIDVLVEPLDDSWRHPLDALDAGRSLAVVTVTESDDEGVPVGSRSFVEADGETTDAAGREPVPASVLTVPAVAERVDGGESGTARVETDAGTVAVFVDALRPPLSLLVWGWQHDVHPVTRLARTAGFRVTVATGRGGQSDPDRFPHADRVVTTHPADIADVVSAPEHTYAVLMSHDFVDDRFALESLLGTDVPYVGLMGPRKRFEEMREAFAEEGVSFTDEQLSRIATPVGLDLGGGEPSHIALSIVSEVLAARNGRDGGRLVESAGPIHSRSAPAKQS